MLTKIKISIVLFVLASLIGTGLFVTQTIGHESGNEINYLYADLSINATDDRELVGFADNVFIGKVIAQTGNETDDFPQTQFSVKVLENIKGNLDGTVTVNQFGGYEYANGEKYLSLMEGDTLLKPGKKYLFATQGSAEGWLTLAAGYGEIPIKDEADHKKTKERFNKALEEEIPYKFK